MWMQWRILLVLALVAVSPCLSTGTDDRDPKIDVCSLEPEVGPCYGAFPRFFYNSTSKECEEFIYGGCDGNGNNFETLDECLQECRSGECPVEGQVYSTCASACTFTCDNFYDMACIAVCTTGCDCPGGQVIDTEINKCVAVEECPNYMCVYNGESYFPGETFVAEDDCNICTCFEGGVVSCTDTIRCRRVSKLSCPKRYIGHCALLCLHDADCRGLRKCCSTGCGTDCLIGRWRPDDDQHDSIEGPIP